MAAGALAVIFPAAASRQGFFPLCLVLPLQGSVTFLAFVPQLEALSESLTHSIPRSLVVALSASAVGFADTLWLCPERVLSRFFASVSLIDPIALSPLLHRVFADGFRLWCAFRLCGGASPLAFGSVGPLGSCGGSTYIALHQTWLVSANLPYGFGAQVSVSYFLVQHSARIHGDHFVSFPDSCVSLPRIYHGVLFLGHLTRRVIGLTLCPPPRSSKILSFALTYSHDSLILMHPAIDIVWQCPCLPRLRLL